MYDQSSTTGFTVDIHKVTLVEGAIEPHPVNVQDNSILVEKDTAKRYWRTPPTSATFEDEDFGTGYTYNGAYFAATGSSGYTFTENASNIDTVMHKDLTTSVVGTKYVMRFPFTITSFTGHTTSANNHKQEVGLGASYSTGEDGSHDFVGLRYVLNQNLNTMQFLILARDGTTKTYATGYSIAYASVSTPLTHYIEIIRNGDVHTINVYSDSAYSTLLGTASVTQTGITGLRYYTHNLFTQATNGVSNGSSTGYDIYNGVASVEGSTWTWDSGYETDFSSSTGWTNGGGGDIAISSGSLAYDCGSGGTSDSRSYYDLGTDVSESEWVLRFKMTSTVVSNSASSCHLGFGLSSITSYYGTNGSALVFVRGAGTSANDNQYYLSRATLGSFVDNGNANKAGFATSTGNVTNQVYYVELKRTSVTSVVATIFSDAYVTAVESETFTNLSGVTGLRYLKCASRSQNTNTNSGTIDDVIFYNGVSSV